MITITKTIGLGFDRQGLIYLDSTLCFFPTHLLSLRMMDPPEAEFTIICIDNARMASLSKNVYDAQIEGTKMYCEVFLKGNPMNEVSIITMSSKDFRLLVSPTSDLQKIKRALEDVSCEVGGNTRFVDALSLACSLFCESFLDRKRLIMFVKGVLSLELYEALSYGKELEGVALDVINFKIEEGSYFGSTKRPRYHYARRELLTLVTAVNDNNGNARIEDVLVKREYSVIYLLKSILKFLG